MMFMVLMMLMVKQQCKACGADDGPPLTCQRAANQTCVLKEKQTWDYAGILAPLTESLLTFNGKTPRVCAWRSRVSSHYEIESMVFNGKICRSQKMQIFLGLREVCTGKILQ
jgi:hypothetical protein